MFFILNKQKIYSYLIAASTVVILFILSIFFSRTDIETMETTTNTETINTVNTLNQNNFNRSTNMTNKINNANNITDNTNIME